METEQEFEMVQHCLLREHPMNARRGDEESIGESMDVNGFYGTVTAQKSSGFILAGNHRFRVAVARGAELIPTCWVECDDQAALRILLADNKTADAGSYDDDQLRAVMDALPDLGGTGYLGSLQAILDSDPPDEAPAPDPVIPEDKHVPLFGILVLCDGEEDQEAIYGTLKGVFPSRELRVVAV